MMEGRYYPMKWFRRGEPSPQRPESGVDQEQQREFEDILREAQSVVRVKRWEVREEPFRGFESQPGRF